MVTTIKAQRRDKLKKAGIKLEMIGKRRLVTKEKAHEGKTLKRCL